MENALVTETRVAREPAVVAREPAAAALEPAVLIVDDSPENLRVLSDILMPHFRVRAANSGERALEIAGRLPRPDLVLLDVMMPELDGWGVLARLRARAETRDIPVIFLTAMDSAADEEKGLGLGAVDYITKPARPLVVLARVRAQVELKRARDSLARRNLQLESEVSRQETELQRVREVSMIALARLARTRDPETGAHIRRTQEYVRVLAQHLRRLPGFAASLSDQMIDLLYKSAPLHDIGKVGIPDHILLKPGPLTPEEAVIMKTHARIGAEAIASAEAETGVADGFLVVAKEMAHWHHERWDGRGYPDGLKGDAIPISARVMALADVFDALITKRVYKPAFSFERAREIILGGRDSQFDPDVVDAFEANFTKFVDIAGRYRDEDDAPGLVASGG